MQGFKQHCEATESVQSAITVSKKNLKINNKLLMPQTQNDLLLIFQ